jgi:hypothetical protein
MTVAIGREWNWDPRDGVGLIILIIVVILGILLLRGYLSP